MSLEDVDILCFSETFLKLQDVNILQIPGYKLAASFCRNKSWGGVCLYVKKNINFQLLQCTESLSMAVHFECCGILLPELNYVVICMYRTPDSNFDIFIKCLDSLLHKLTIRSRHAKRKVIIAGDFNVNILENSKNCKLFKNTLLKYNLKPAINEPTRITNSSSTCIDNILTNLKSYSSKVLHLGLSDHSGQMISIPCNQGFIEKYWYVNSRNVNNYLDIFLRYMSQCSFSEVYLYNDVNLAYKTFINMFKLIFELCIPLQQIRVSYKKKNDWQTKGIYRASKIKRSLYMKILHKKNISLIPHYKKYCKVLKSVIRLAKQKFNISFIKKSTNKNRATWNLIQKQTSAKNTFKSTIDNLIVDNNVVTNVNIIAKLFNNHFISISTSNGCNKNNTCNEVNKIYHLPPPNIHSIYLTPVDIHELKKIVKGLKNKRSCGLDDIPMQVIKHSFEYIGEPLVYILNLMIETGVFPDDLKKAKIKPLFKKGSKSNINDYRPIALLSNFSKIFEKVIYNRLLEFLTKYNLLNENQFGFQKKRSTTLAIYKILGKIWDSLNNKIPCVGLFLDMSRAFDCVKYKILLHFLENLGVRGLALDLLKSYLQNREQVTVIDFFDKAKKTFKEVLSEPKEVILGLPQGSILGPLLFLIYVNQLPNIMNNLCVMFADDATIFIPDTSRNTTNFENNINEILRTTVNWLNSINLNVNLSKTKIIQFRNYQTNPYPLKIKQNNTIVEKVNEINFLGVTIDAHLNWKSHILKINNKISSYCYALSILIETTSVEVARAAYFGHIYPLLTYGIIFWGNSVNVQSTFILQKKCLRIIYNMYSYETVRNIFKENGYLTLTCIYILEIATFVKKNGQYFENTTENLRTQRNKYKYNICVPRINNALYYKSAYSSGIKIFNHLPVEIKALCLPTFKFKLKEWLKKYSFYGLEEYFNKRNV